MMSAGVLQRRFANVLIALGAVLLAVWGAARLHSILGSRRDRAAFEAARAAAPTTPPPAPTPTPVPIPEAGPVDVSLWSGIRIKEWKESLAADRRPRSPS